MLAGCTTADLVTPKSAIELPPPPAFMNGCRPPAVKEGDMPNAAFDAAQAAFKACTRAGAASRRWYLGVKARYGASPLPGAH